jgi:peroxin-5
MPLQVSTSTIPIDQHQNLDEADELARTAGLVANSVKYEQNPKFQNSQFIELMKQLRDQEVVVEGNQVVAKGGAGSSNEFVDMKGKGKAVDPQKNGTEQIGQGYITPYTSPEIQRNAQTFGQSLVMTYAEDLITSQDPSLQQGPHSETSQQEAEQEDPNDAYFLRENEEYSHWHNVHASRSPQPTGSWGELQDQWDSFEATSTGIKAIENYQFQSNNPYLHGDSSGMRQQSSERPQTFYEVCFIARLSLNFLLT